MVQLGLSYMRMGAEKGHGKQWHQEMRILVGKNMSVKNEIKCASRYIILSVLFAAAIFSGLFLDFYMSTAITGCDGIEYFYTGNGFEYDYPNILELSFKERAVGRLNMKDMSSDNAYMISPKDIIETNKTYDCETISNAIMCLSKEYNVTCKFYKSVHFSEILYNAHLGIYCWNDKYETWKKLY